MIAALKYPLVSATLFLFELNSRHSGAFCDTRGAGPDRERSEPPLPDHRNASRAPSHCHPPPHQFHEAGRAVTDLIIHFTPFDALSVQPNTERMAI